MICNSGDPMSLRHPVTQAWSLSVTAGMRNRLNALFPIPFPITGKRAADPCGAGMGWLRLVGSLKLQVSFAKKPYKRDYVLQKRPIILRSLLIVATPYVNAMHSAS